MNQYCSTMSETRWDVSPTNHCLCLQNIKLFLCTCQDVFGLKDSDLFEPSMLFEIHDIYQVIYTLSKLSNCNKAQKSVPGFFFQKNQIFTQTDISKKLSIDDGRYSQELREKLSYNNYRSSVRYEENYQKLCAFKRPQSPQHSEKRILVAEELLETEIKYVMVLKAIQECFMKPLRKKMSPEDIQGIFGEIEELYDIHQNFLNDLNDAISPNSLRHLSDVFLSKYHKFLIYGDYCANIMDAQTLLQQKIKESPSLNEDIMRCQESVKEGRYALEDLLYMPFQRILKYPLLLDRLIGDTQPNHEDYRGLEEANDAMKDIAVYINELKRDKEKLEALQKIEESIIDLKMPPNTTLKNYGRCLKDDELRVRSPYGEKSNNRYVFLFDHVMLICKQLKDNKYSFQESLDLSEYKVKDCLPTARRATFYPWFLIPENKNEVYMFSARQEQQKREWIKVIEETLDNIKPNCLLNTDHQLLMKTFQKQTTCTHCKKSLKGLIFQGYWCKMCQIILHKECIIPSGRCTAQAQRSLPVMSVNTRRVPPPPYSEVTRWTDYRYLGQYNWFVGEIEREEASNLLRQRKNGTYLVRVRPRGRSNPSESTYALGLKTSTGIKHIVVFERTINGLLQYYLSRARYFTSIAELVKFYEHTSLKENFEKLDTKLLLPYYQVPSVVHARNFPREESTEWTGRDSDEDYADYDQLEDNTKTGSTAICPTGTFKSDDHSVHTSQEASMNTYFTVKESDMNYSNDQTSYFQNSASFYGSSSEKESDPSQWQQWSNKENNWHESPALRTAGIKHLPTYNKDRRSLGTSRSFPKTSAEENRRVHNLHVKTKRTRRENTKVVKTSNPSISKTYAGDFPRKNVAKSFPTTNVKESKTRTPAHIQSIKEFDDRKSLTGSSKQRKTQIRHESLKGRSTSKSPTADNSYTTKEEKLQEERVGQKKEDEEAKRPEERGEEQEEDDNDAEEEGEDDNKQEEEEEIFWQYCNDNEIATLYESKSLYNISKNFDTGTENFHSASVPEQKQAGSSLTVGTQTSSLDIPSSYDHIEIFGQFIVSELKTIQNKTILIELKKAIQNVVMQGIEKDNEN
ncbi:protein vav isoform X2 [Anabrus simplex]|uniref:protein vav isoform X2 n=1 Tax=Anabrus simplex TaxID=316456 RepID=UPI0035A2B5BA